MDFYARQPSATGDVTLRCLDMIVAVTALTIFWPVLLIISIAIFAESGSPVFFRQLRLGQKGRTFQILKFRKFHRDCSPRGFPLTLTSDSRLTYVGKFLVRTKLDELPQLFNVLRGDMSIVGPRPESLAFRDCFSNGFEALLDYKPGIVGPSQAAFRSESEFLPKENATEFYRDVLFPLKGLVDLKYYSRRTLWSDLFWITTTFLTVFGFNLPVVPFQQFRRPSRTRPFEVTTRAFHVHKR
jgi:lipopolysaccharide/colanic/teichoic acid biosynthesis glycosyltransferase